MILDGKALSSSLRAELKKKSLRFCEITGHKPALAVILVGNNPASEVYVRNKEKAASEVGFDCIDVRYPSDVVFSELSAEIRRLNEDKNTDGILVQLPLPEHIDVRAVTDLINPMKDVDCFTSHNSGLLFQGRAILEPCTPKGIFTIFSRYDIPLDGKNVCIVGRSDIVGRPLAALFLTKTNATVTVCNSHTENLKEHLLGADIIVCAAGKAGLVTADMVKNGAVVIDVGINRIEDPSKKSGYRLTGDADYEGVSEKASAITPVPGGVGPMTIASLLENTLTAACVLRGIDMNELKI